MSRTQQLGLIIVILFTSSCQTIWVPMLGTHVNRAKAQGGIIGARMMAGVALVPEAQGTVDEVKNKDDIVVNPIPENSSKGLYPVPNFDLGLGFAERFDIGLSYERGIYGIVDVYQGEHISISVTPAVNNSLYDNKARTKSCDKDGNCEEREVGGNINAEYKTTNVYGLIAYSPFGETYWGSLHIYGMFGTNHYDIKITETETKTEKTKSGMIPVYGFGLQGKLFIFEANYEYSLVSFKQRDGTNRTFFSPSFSTGIRLDFFADDRNDKSGKKTST